MAKHRHMATHLWVNIGLVNDLLPYGAKPSYEPMLTYHWSIKPIAIHKMVISQVIPQQSVTEIILQIVYLNFRLNPPAVNELIPLKCLHVFSLSH